MLRSVLVLENPIQNYAWGSRTAIGELLGRPIPAAQPEAELWIGAHPKAPSRVVDPPGLGTLDRVIEEQPQAVLGASACARFGNELPFLFKVLAAAEPLSIQAHPSQEQARRGWARENAEGIPLDAPRRNYRDPNHKPELVCALTPFTALLGFREPEAIARSLDPLARTEMAPEIDRAGREGAPALRALFARLLTLDGDESRPVLARAAQLARRGHRDPAWAWVGRLLARHPGDIGALAPLYLNLVSLEPGEALFLPAGELHAYLEGTALELMANSDNVLRGGLTPKHVDVPELLATLSFEPKPAEVLRAAESAPGEWRYPTPAREFELGLLELRPGRPFVSAPGHGVEILLGLSGEATIRGDGRELPLGRGRTVLVPAALPLYTLEGRARLARARLPG